MENNNTQGNLNKDFNIGHGSIAMSDGFGPVNKVKISNPCNCKKPISVKIKKLYDDVVVPEQATSGSAGFDLRAYLKEDIILGSLERVKVPTGISIKMPTGVELQVRARSGNAINKGMSLINGIGTIDSDFTGEIQALVVNLSKNNIIIKNGDKIAQGVFNKYESPKFIIVEDLEETERGCSGFGSTGD